MDRVAERIGGLLAVVVSIVVTVIVLGTCSGVVQERCASTVAVSATGAVQVDSHWTYVLWPPLFLASIDPAGRCVRNSPLHVGLSAIGLWKLPSAEDQVRQHIVDQTEIRAVRESRGGA